MTDNEIIIALEAEIRLAEISAATAGIPADLLVGNRYNVLSLLKLQAQQIEALTAQRDQARLDCAVAEANHRTAVEDFKAALLEKIFPYGVVDKKNYSINAFAVEMAISKVAKQIINKSRG